MRAGTVVALTSAPLLAATSAFAANFQGEDPGPRLSVLQTLGIFLGIPIALFLIIAFLVMLPGWVRGDRNRAEIGWDEQSAARAREELRTGSLPRTEGEKAEAGTSSSGTGGASGSW